MGQANHVQRTFFTTCAVDGHLPIIDRGILAIANTRIQGLKCPHTLSIFIPKLVGGEGDIINILLGSRTSRRGQDGLGTTWRLKDQHQVVVVLNGRIDSNLDPLYMQA